MPHADFHSQAVPCGHFHKNWADENVRRMILNALMWTAKVEVPEGGVQSALPAD